MRPSSLIASGLTHTVVLGLCALGIDWRGVQPVEYFEVRVDHRTATRAARPLEMPEPRPPIAVAVVPLDREPILSPDLVPVPSPRPETFGLPIGPPSLMDRDPVDEETTREPGVEIADELERSELEERTFEAITSLDRRPIFAEHLEAVPEPTPTDPATRDSTETAETPPPPETSETDEPETDTADAESARTSGAQARLRGRVHAPRYPDRAVQMHLEGDVVVEFSIDRQGEVTSATVVDDLSVRFGMLRREAERAVRTWLFDPATSKGQPVESRLRVRIRFRIRSGVEVDDPRPEGEG